MVAATAPTAWFLSRADLPVHAAAIGSQSSKEENGKPGLLHHVQHFPPVHPNIVRPLNRPSTPLMRVQQPLQIKVGRRAAICVQSVVEFRCDEQLTWCVLSLALVALTVAFAMQR